MSISGSSPSDDLFWNDINLLSKTAKLSSLTVKDGKLCKKSIVDRIKGLIPKEQKDNRELLKQRLKEIVKFTKDKHFPYLTKQLFLTKIAELKDPEFIYQLREEQLLTKELESSMSLELGRLRDNKENSPKEKSDETAKLARRIERAKLAGRLGISSEANKGQTGTALIRSTSGKKIAVFKPTHPDTPLVARCKNAVKRNFGGQLYFLSHKSKAQAEAEVAAYHLDRHFGFGLSPESEMVKLEGKEGAFQLFIKSRDETQFKEAKELVGNLEQKSEYSLQELELFQKMAVFDFLIGNLDRHEENWFVKEIGGNISELKTIDNANSFLRKNPSSGDKIGNQYKWRKLKIADSPLTEQMKQFIRETLTSTNIQAFVQKLQQDLPEFLDDEMKHNLYVRVAVLLKAAKEPDFPLYNLGLLITDEDMQDYLQTA